MRCGGGVTPHLPHAEQNFVATFRSDFETPTMFCGLCRPARGPVAEQNHAREVEAAPAMMQMSRSRTERVLKPLPEEEEDAAVASRSGSRSQSSLVAAARRRTLLAAHEVRFIGNPWQVPISFRTPHENPGVQEAAAAAAAAEAADGETVMAFVDAYIEAIKHSQTR